MHKTVYLLILLFIPSHLLAFEVSPGVVEVNHEQQADPILTFELSTDLPDGVAWETVSDQPFVSFASNTGVSPEPIQVTVDQIAFAKWVAPQNSLTGAAVTVTANNEEFSVPVRLKAYPFQVREVLRRSHPTEMIARTYDFSSRKDEVIKIEMATGLILQRYEIPDQTRWPMMNPQGTKAYMRAIGRDAENRSFLRVLDLESMTEEPLSHPFSGITLAGVGEDFLLLRAGSTITINGERVQGYFTFDPETQEAIHVFQSGEFRGGEPEPVSTLNIAGDGGDLLMVSNGVGSGLWVNRVERDQLVPVFDDPTFPVSFNSTADPVFQFHNRQQNRLFFRGIALELNSGDFQRLRDPLSSSDQSGQVIASRFGLEYFQSDEYLVGPAKIPPYFGPSFFSSDDQFLFLFNVAEEKSLRFIETVDLTPLPPPTPLPEQRVPTQRPVFSAPPVGGATSYRLTVTRTIDGTQIVRSSETSDFELNEDLPLGSRYAWQIDAITADGEIAGSESFFETRYPFPPVIPLEGGVSTNGNQVAALDFWEKVTWAILPDNVEGPVEDLREKLIVPLPENLQVSSNQRVLPLGNKLFIRSSEGISYFEKMENGSVSPPRTLPIPGNGSVNVFGQRMGAAGDLLFVTNASSEQSQGQIEVFRTTPNVVHETTIAIPRHDDGSVVPFYEIQFAAAGDILAVTTWNQPEAKVHLFQMQPDSADYSLIQTFRERGRLTGGSVEIVTDGRQVAIPLELFEDSGRTKRVIFYNRTSGDQWEAGDRVKVEYPDFQTSRRLALSNGTLAVRAFVDNIRIFRERDSLWSLETTVHKLEHGVNIGSISPAQGMLVMGVSDAPRTEGLAIIPNVFPREGVPDFLNQGPTIMGTRQVLDFPLHVSEGTARVFLNRGPEWLSVVGNPEDGFRLQGTAPENDELTTIRLRAEGEGGLVATRTFDLKISEEFQPPSVNLLTTGLLAGIEGTNVILEGEVTGTGTYELQWLRNGIPLTDQDRAQLFLNGLNADKAGFYRLRLTALGNVSETEAVEVLVEPASSLGGGWPMAGASEEGTRFRPANIRNHEPILKWHQEGQFLPPVGLDDKIYATRLAETSSPGHLAMAFKTTTGEIIWEYQTEDQAQLGSPAANLAQVHFGMVAGDRTWRFLTLGAEDGQVLWTEDIERDPFGLQEITEFPPIVAEGRIWLGMGTPRTYSRLLEGSEPRLIFPDGERPNSLAFTEKRGFFASGNVVGEFALGDSTLIKDFGVNPRLFADRNLATSGNRGTIIEDFQLLQFDLTSGEIIHRFQPGNHQGNGGLYFNFSVSGSTLVGFNISQSRLSDPVTRENDYLATLDVFDTSSGNLEGRIPIDLRTFSVSRPHVDLLLLNDSLIASSVNGTLIFDLETLDLTHHLPEFGEIIYSDGHLVVNHRDSNLFNGALSVYNLNARPEIIPPGLTEALEDQQYVFDLTADHFEDNETLTYELVGQSDWITVTPEGQITIAPLQEDIGDDPEKQEQYTIRVSDGVTTPVEQTFSITLIAVNDNPIIALDELVTDEDSAPLTRDLLAFTSDEESPVEDLAFQLSADSSGEIAAVSLEGSNLTILLLPDQFGIFTFELTVTDPDGGETREEISVTINPVNDPPDSSLAEVINEANPDGRDQTLDLSEILTDRDPGDRLAFTIQSNDRPELFRSLALDEDTGILTIAYAPYISGQATVTVVATDLEGATVSLPLITTLPEPAAPTITAGGPPDVESQIILNPQTGLFEQKLTLTNNAARAIGGFSLTVAGLTNDFRLYQDAPDQVIYGTPIKVGQSVNLTLEYYSPSSGQTPTPTLSVVPILPQPQNAAETLGQPIGQVLVLEDQSILLEFDSDQGAEYVIQYSFDMITWYHSPVKVVGQTGRTQWLDQGLPRTPCHPRDCASRFYRVLRIVSPQ